MLYSSYNYVSQDDLVAESRPGRSSLVKVTPLGKLLLVLPAPKGPTALSHNINTHTRQTGTVIGCALFSATSNKSYYQYSFDKWTCLYFFLLRSYNFKYLADRYQTDMLHCFSQTRRKYLNRTNTEHEMLKDHGYLRWAELYLRSGAGRLLQRTELIDGRSLRRSKPTQGCSMYALLHAYPCYIESKNHCLI